MISGVILAAGSSSRLGRPKQLLALDGRPILEHVLEAAEVSGTLGELVLVLGHAADEIEALVRLPGNARIVRNAEFELGQSTSLRVGLWACDPASEAAVILLGDQPRISPAAIRAVADGFARTGHTIVRARYRDGPGHPVLVAREEWESVLDIRGDTGARDLITARPEWVHEVGIDADRPWDVDTWADYERLVGERRPEPG